MSELLAEPYTDLEQQRETAQLGMWVFLATEVLFFGGLFAAYTVYRFRDPAAFRLVLFIAIAFSRDDGVF